MSSVKKNFSYNLIYQILILIVPLVTAPYVSRVIGAEGQGIFSYTYSIVQYFGLFAMLGLSNYGNRTIAKNRGNKKRLSKEFWSIYILQLITSSIVMLIYIIYICVFVKQYKIYAIFQLIYMMSVFFDINWFFFGMEKFKLTVTRNIIIKLLSIVNILLFVKSKDDLILYTIIMTSTTFISNIALWPFVKKEVDFVKITVNDIRKHIKPNFILFIPVIAVSLYKIMDKVMLGSMSTIENVGYYENAEKIINILMAFITSLGTVMLPRISNLVAKGKRDEIDCYINKSMEFVMFLSIPLAFGLLAIGGNFAPIFFGNEFIVTGHIIEYLSFTIIFISWANVIRTQYLIPNEKDKEYIISVFLGAVVNFIINIILIPRYSSIGAAIGTIFAEAAVMFYQTYVVRNQLRIKRYLMYLIKFLTEGIVMFIIVKMLELWIHNIYFLLIIQVIIGGIIYMGLNYKYILINMKSISTLKK